VPIFLIWPLKVDFEVKVDLIIVLRQHRTGKFGE